MQIIRVKARADAALSRADLRRPLGQLSVGHGLGRIKAEHAVALLRRREVMGAVRGVLGHIHRDVPCPLEPLVLPAEQQPAAAARLSDILGHLRVESALLVLVESALLIAVDAEISSGREKVFFKSLRYAR